MFSWFSWFSWFSRFSRCSRFCAKSYKIIKKWKQLGKDMSGTGPRHTMFWARFTSNVEDRGPRYSFPWLDSMFELSSKCFYDFHDFHDFSWIVMMCHFSWIVMLPSSSLFFSLLLSSSLFFQLLPTSSNFYLLLLSSFLFQEEGPRSRVSCSVSAFPRSTRSVVWQNYSCSWRTTSNSINVWIEFSPSGPAQSAEKNECCKSG